MGNMVIVAVRHSDLETTRNLDYSLLELMIGEHEVSSPKFFDGGYYSHYYSDAYNGHAILSGAYHSSSNVNLVVTNQMMSYFPSFINILNERDKYDNSKKVIFSDYVLKKAISSAKNSESLDLKSGEKITVRKSKSKKWDNLSGGYSYSLFGILTDYMFSIDEETIMNKIVDSIDTMEWIDNDQVISGTSSDSIKGAPIIPLGNYKYNQIALVSMSRNVFSVLCVKNHGIDYEGIIDKMDNAEDSNLGTVNISSFKEIIRGFKRIAEYHN